MTPEQIVLRFVESIGDPAEVRLYLELFRSGEPQRFAIVDVDRGLDGPQRAALVADLGYLVALGLSPVLWSSQAGEALAGSLDGLPVELASDAAGVAEIAGSHRLALVGGRSIAAWAAELASRKVILLGGGLRAAGGAAISMIDRTTEIESLEAAGLAPGHAARLRRAAAIIDQVPQPITVALTSAVDLLRELFTVGGAGTLVRRGAAIRCAGEVGDRPAMAALLEEAFGRPVSPALFERRFAAVYVAGDHTGAALIESAEPAPYLSKFAVGLAARGEGVGRDLWRRIRADFPRLHWRARAANPITRWYVHQAHGFHRCGPWNVFWIGLEAGEIAAAIEGATARAPDFDL